MATEFESVRSDVEHVHPTPATGDEAKEDLPTLGDASVGGKPVDAAEEDPHLPRT